MLAIEMKLPEEVRRDIASRFKDRRLTLNLTQKDLAARAGVSWASLKRFEREGLVSLESLLKIALVLDCLGDFDKLVVDTPEIPAGRTLDSILAKPVVRRRATGKKAQIT
jgi:transcriptional regulator with XRE-family HTH domain